ncbi:hypothetical protein B6V01_003730 [Methanosarcinales archaeon ex4572_44]|nr:MAG: hypothetical protein B6V01_003730 [Methanosarcinales archaeon ex4572_44]
MPLTLLECDIPIPEREKHTYIKKSDEDIVPRCNVQTTPGDLTERGCTYAGCMGVVGGPVKDVIHLVHGPIGCAYYTWGGGRRQNLSDNPEFHRKYCFSTSMQHELGMTPAVIATGTESKEFVADVQAVASQTGHEIKIISRCDLYELHEAVKAVGVDLLMGNSQAKYIADDEGGSLSHESDFLSLTTWATSEERSSDTAAGSILSIGSRTRYWNMRTRRECMVLLGRGGGLILTVLLWGVRIFIKYLPKYSHKACGECAFG